MQEVSLNASLSLEEPQYCAMVCIFKVGVNSPKLVNASLPLYFLTQVFFTSRICINPKFKITPALKSCASVLPGSRVQVL